jgi:hypothetical protein
MVSVERCSTAVDAGEQVGPLLEVTVAEEVLERSAPSVPAHAIGFGRIVEKRSNRSREAPEIACIGDQATSLTGNDLVDDPAHRAADDRS